MTSAQYRKKQQAERRAAERKAAKAEARKLAKLQADPEWRAEMERRSKASPNASLTAHKNRPDHYIGNGAQN